MQISQKSISLKNWDGSIVIFGLLNGDIETQLELLADVIEKDYLLQVLKDQNFGGEVGEICSFNLTQDKLMKLVIIGLGKPEKLLADGIRQATSIAARECLGSSEKIGFIYPWEVIDYSIAAKAIGEAIRLSTFKDLRFRSNPEEIKRPEKIELLGLPQIENTLINQISPICAGVELARELVGAPPNILTPSELANQALEISKEFKLEAKILNRKQCAEKGMGSYLAVAKGSDLEPKFIHLTYKPNSPAQKKIVMVGKGLTFDSGGYNLKVGAAQIEKMKYDMGGSAAVIGAARAIGELAPENIEVHFIVAACENMINGSALHPGDIITASNGKTIEVNNTDAEGRLTLADALVYACKLEPDSIVDLATLTGACVIALGDEIAGLWSESEELAKELEIAAEHTGEGLWRMPMRNSYRKGLKSMLADIKNTGPRAGGSITAALFLKEFVTESIPWAHIDIAGTCWTDKDNGINPSGATGYGVRTLVEWACNKAIPHTIKN
ncbi:leucyl aminopeptidase [Prochlorococcus sp. MIT 1223]|uniref:leucyl aminopeptidase n=1 Tax=Prochlorococcus sp. MIT 1223 TaxID=3096217 RepID=UPI002A7611C7|nr:leucyl aminopeptidase [Prochlorococcus sp. MIT 1223]